MLPPYPLKLLLSTSFNFCLRIDDDAFDWLLEALIPNSKLQTPNFRYQTSFLRYNQQNFDHLPYRYFAAIHIDRSSLYFDSNTCIQNEPILIFIFLSTQEFVYSSRHSQFQSTSQPRISTYLAVLIHIQSSLQNEHLEFFKSKADSLFSQKFLTDPFSVEYPSVN